MTLGFSSFGQAQGHSWHFPFEVQNIERMLVTVGVLVHRLTVSFMKTQDYSSR